MVVGSEGTKLLAPATLQEPCCLIVLIGEFLAGARFRSLDAAPKLVMPYGMAERPQMAHGIFLERIIRITRPLLICRLLTPWLLRAAHGPSVPLIQLALTLVEFLAINRPLRLGAAHERREIIGGCGHLTF